MIDSKPKSKGLCINREHTSLNRKQYILLHPKKASWIVINELGYKIFSSLKGDISIGIIAGQISRQYDLPFDRALSDTKNFIALLSRAGFVDFPSQSPINEKGQEKVDFSLKKIHLNITENCNLQCKHCAVYKGEKQKDGLSTEQIVRIIDEAEDLKVELLAITGGEPLLRQDCLKILSHAARKINTVLATNGSLVDEYTAGFLTDLNITLQISLDGPNSGIHDFIRGPGAFKRTLKVIHGFVNKGAGERMALCVTVSKNNLPHIPAILQLALDEGVSSVRFIPIQQMGMAQLNWNELALSAEDYSQLYHYLYLKAPKKFPTIHISPGFQGLVLHHPGQRQMWCQIGQLLAIDAKGGIYPCPLLMEPIFRAGNITRLGLDKALKSSKIKEVRELCLFRKSRISECQACRWVQFCQGGCPGSIYQLKGQFYDVDDLCKLRQSLYTKLIFTLAEKGNDPILSGCIN